MTMLETDFRIEEEKKRVERLALFCTLFIILATQV
jgi:hypothetical protein